jgi:hypothetical protein
MLGVGLLFFGAYAIWFALEIWWTVKSGRLGPLHRLVWRQPPPRFGVERMADRLAAGVTLVFGLALVAAGLLVILSGE